MKCCITALGENVQHSLGQIGLTSVRGVLQ